MCVGSEVDVDLNMCWTRDTHVTPITPCLILIQLYSFSYTHSANAYNEKN